MLRGRSCLLITTHASWCAMHVKRMSAVLTASMCSLHTRVLMNEQLFSCTLRLQSLAEKPSMAPPESQRCDCCRIQRTATTATTECLAVIFQTVSNSKPDSRLAKLLAIYATML